MQRTLLNLIIDLAAGVLFLAMMATGYLLRFPLPPGTNKVLSLWGLSRHQWGEVHLWISLVLVSIIVVHFILHWQWLVTVIRQRLHRAKSKTGRAGLITGLVIVGLFVTFAWAAHVSVQELPDPCCAGMDTTDPKAVAGTVSAIAPGPKTSQAPVFNTDVLPILERSCLPCHGPAKARGNFRVDRNEDFLSPRNGIAWVIPGNTGQSVLLQLVNGERDIAFPDRHKLPAADVAVLKSWIAAGADFGP